MPFNKMSNMLVGVSVGWGGSEDFSRSMGSSDDVTAETMSIASYRMSVFSCMWHVDDNEVRTTSITL